MGRDGRRGGGTAPEWSDHDTAVWHSRDVARRLRDGTLHERPPAPSPFPPTYGAAEHMLASGPFRLLTFRAVGDGTYVQNTGFFFATGGAGLAATAVVAGARALGNSNRRAAAAAAAEPRWVVDDEGVLWVSTHGFYLYTAQALYRWEWASVDALTLVAPRAVHLQGTSENGPVSWIVDSDWAELVFVVWAHHRHPGHPQALGEAWIPPGWHARDAARLAREGRPAIEG